MPLICVECLKKIFILSLSVHINTFHLFSVELANLAVKYALVVIVEFCHASFSFSSM